MLGGNISRAEEVLFLAFEALSSRQRFDAVGKSVSADIPTTFVLIVHWADDDVHMTSSTMADATCTLVGGDFLHPPLDDTFFGAHEYGPKNFLIFYHFFPPVRP